MNASAIAERLAAATVGNRCPAFIRGCDLMADRQSFYQARTVGVLAFVIRVMLFVCADA